MTDPQDTTKSTTNNDNVITEINIINDDLPNSDEILQNDGPKLNCDKIAVEYSKNLEIGGKKVVVVETEDQLLSGKTAPACCVVGSSEHVAALKAKIDELKLNSIRLEQERAEALENSESVTKQLDHLVEELKELGHGSDTSEQTIHATIHTFGNLQKLEIIADEDDGERLTRKPRVRQYWYKGALHREADERSSSYSELFWDLIFVAVISNLGSMLISDISINGFVPLYYRYGTKNPANHIHTRTFESADEPTLTMDSTKSSPPSPHKAMKTKGTEYHWKWTDMFSILKITEYRTAVNIEHYSERFGLFTVVCLGESIFSVIYASLNKYPDIFLAKAILGLVIAYNLHWIYFDVDASRQYQHALRRHVITGLLFGLIHIPLNMSLIAFGSSLGRIVMLADFHDAEHTPKPKSLREAGETESSEFSTPLAILFCASLAVSMYCMAIIGILHKSLDSVNCTKISKVNNDITICKCLFFHETYGRLKWNAPLFGNCEDHIIPKYDEEEDEVKRYVRWRWGSANLSKRGFSRGFLRRKTTNKNEKIDDEVNVVVK
ncbi:13045_t:CDS:10 [Cetraspora pellucida]|uniref:13045_t:CDS:1 n=1 Tax=Cetraspora pellucida TaxID=1433469 RepID=A0ACA9KJI1_9GLOM|nr:13045_t:CDS:10 [Cetraspora pellucida]